VIPVARAGVVTRPWRPSLACGGQTLSTVPIRDSPGCRVRVRRASARQRRASGAQRSRKVAVSRAMDAVLMPPAPGARRLRVSPRAGVPAIIRRAPSTIRRWTSRFTTCARRRLRQGRNRGRPGVPPGSGWRQVARTARLSAHQPAGQHQSGRGAAPRWTAAINRGISVMSRCSLTSPPSHTRVRTIRASAIHTRPPGVLTRRASACTGPQSRGGSTT